MNESGGKLMGADKRVGNSGRRATSRWVRGTTLTAVIAIGLGGCSSLPDWANPVDWYDSAFSTDGTAPPQSTRKVADASDSKSFPALKSVPAKAPATSSDADRATVTSGLIADRDKAKYTDWRRRADIKAELKVDLIILLAEHGYPPVDRDEVYKEIFEQAENFKKYQSESNG